ncbi:MAG TPA: universal stress protein [Jatrophihabitans sp.]|nr:universal stress protein [Jatrophihabitans sp.]
MTDQADTQVANAPVQVDGPVSPIVVGVSRRTGSLDALRWAAAEAQLRQAPVLAVTAWRGPRAPAAPGGRPPAISPEPLEDAFALERARILERLEAALGGLAALNIRYSLRRGSASSVLLSAAVGAQLLVLDSPRSGALSTLAKSMIAPQVIFRAPCPVVLMPPPVDSAADVLPSGGLTAPDPV